MPIRRNTLTALFFLAGLLTAVLYLWTGALPQNQGFLPVDKPVRSSARTKADVIAQLSDPEDAPLVLRETPPPLGDGLGLKAVTYMDLSGETDRFIEDTEPAIQELLDRDRTFIELYGGIQKAAGRRVVEDVDPQYTVVKLADEMLTFASLENEQMDMTNRAQELLEFVQRVKKEYRTPVLYVQAPSKLDVSPLPAGMPDYADAEADQFLELVEEGGLDTLDLRTVFREAAREDPEAALDLFFRTDHHWTPAGAFLGYQALCDKLKKDYRFKINEEYTDPDSFDKFVFQDVFLGSQGRRVGTLYAGVDDFEVWSPQFSTSFTYTVPIVGIEREGPFVVSLLFPERLADTGYYDTNPYTIYSGDDYLLSRAVNEKNPNGKRVLILRDSFGCALTPFLALNCQEVMAIDPRNFNGNQDTMMDYIDWLEPDLIIVMNAPSSLKVEKLFPYLPTARANARAEKEAEANEKR